MLSLKYRTLAELKALMVGNTKGVLKFLTIAPQVLNLSKTVPEIVMSPP
jgi:hypothetical protein